MVLYFELLHATAPLHNEDIARLRSIYHLDQFGTQRQCNILRLVLHSNHHRPRTYLQSFLSISICFTQDTNVPYLDFVGIHSSCSMRKIHQVLQMSQCTLRIQLSKHMGSYSSSLPYGCGKTLRSSQMCVMSHR